MSNYVVMKDALEHPGIMAIQKNVFHSIIQDALNEHKYINLAEALPFANSISVNTAKGTLFINVDLKVTYGKNILKVLEDIQEKLHETIVLRTNIQNVKVNIKVAGFNF